MVQLRRTLRQRLPLLLALVLAACGFTERVAQAGPGVLTRRQFIAIYVELRRAEQAMPVPETFEAHKREIFERHGTEPRALVEFVEAHGDDVAYMAVVWDSIQHRLETLEGDTAAT